MRSTFAGLNTMVKGIFANQTSLDTVGHNIANASTEGYSRQRVAQAATMPQTVSSLYGEALVGSGVGTLSITRARDTFADKSYWQENATNYYYKAQQKNYDKVESIFTDTGKTGLKNAFAEFYKAWDDLSANASTDANRVTVMEKANVVADRIKTATSQLQDQITSQYENIATTVNTLNSYTEQVVKLNKSILQQEATGANANDLRDQRDELVDQISRIVNVNVYENDNGQYTLVSNGISLVNGESHLTLQMSDPINNKEYGINDYSILIKDAGVAYVPTNGSLKGGLDGIAENKTYIDKMAGMSAFMLTSFNQSHMQGAGINGTDASFGADDGTGTYKGPSYGHNFWGDDDTVYTWNDATQSVNVEKYELGSVQRSVSMTSYTEANGDVVRTPQISITGREASTDSLKGVQIINALQVSTFITQAGGTSHIAARQLDVAQKTDTNGALLDDTYKVIVAGTGDGTNATNVKGLVNMDSENVRKTLQTSSVKANIGGQDVDLVTLGADGSTDPQPGEWKISDRSIGDLSVNNYYTHMIDSLGTNSKSVDDKQDAQDDLITQITEWRSSTNGVDWNEELTNMIQFQKGYSACSRVLTTMDDMLDRLINSTGMVGR